MPAAGFGLRVSSSGRDAALDGSHVVSVISGPGLGGAERNAIDLLHDLRERHGAAVSVCALDGGGGRARELAAELDVPWRVLPAAWPESRIRQRMLVGRVTRTLRGLRPSVLLSWTNRPNILCGLTWPRTGAELAVWNQQDVLGSTRFAEDVIRRALRSMPLVMTTARHTGEWLATRWGVDRERIKVVYSKVELPPPVASRASWRDRLGLAPDDVAACMIAHLHRGKDHPTLLRAWRVVHDRLAGDGRSPVLLLAGRDAGTEDELRSLVSDLRLDGAVRFLGQVTDISGLVDAVDFAVFCSRSECLGRGATEPMSRGRAVVGSDVPGIREAVGAPGADLLAPVGDHIAHADAILQLVRDPALRRRVGCESEALIRRRQSREATTAVYASLLAGALADGSRKRPR
jgi:glycosyltransferase involved in cell wall biosynthesis